MRPVRPNASAPPVATLSCLGSSFTLMHTDTSKGQEQLSLADANSLAERFVLPVVSRDELSVAEAAAIRKREAKQAAADRAAEKQAAVHAATMAWWEQQANLAAELGISYENWQRVVTLLAKPPPTLHAGHLVMNSVAISRPIVIDAAIERAIAEPLHASVQGDSDRDSSDKSDDGDSSDEEETWDVREIHGVKGKGKTLKYHVEWEGFEKEDDWTWEPAACLENNIVLTESGSPRARASEIR